MLYCILITLFKEFQSQERTNPRFRNRKGHLKYLNTLLKTLRKSYTKSKKVVERVFAKCLEFEDLSCKPLKVKSFPMVWPVLWEIHFLKDEGLIHTFASKGSWSTLGNFRPNSMTYCHFRLFLRPSWKICCYNKFYLFSWLFFEKKSVELINTSEYLSMNTQ